MKGHYGVSLLQEIIETSRHSDTSVTQLLRSLRVLAARGNVDDLTEWVRRELNGYGSGDALPPYRGPFAGHAMGTFSGPFGAEETLALPDFGFPGRFKGLFNLELRGPMAELERMLAVDSAKSQLRFHWPANSVVMANQLMEQGKVPRLRGYGLAGVWVPITVNILVTAVDGVRNHILDLALELEQVSPELGSVAGATAEHREEISAKFHQVIIASNVQVGETFSPNYGISIAPGDPASLDRYLAALGIDDVESRKELIKAAENARSQGETDVKSNNKLQAIISKMSGFAQRTGAAATDVLIETLIQRWLGGS